MPFRGPSSSAVRIGVPYEAAPPVPVSAADAAGAVEALSAAAAVPQADAAGAVEAMTIALAAADVAGAAEALSAAVAAPQADVAGAAEALGVAAAVPSADVAGAVESVALTIGPLEADAAGAGEAMTQAVAAPQHDAAGAVEAVTFPSPIASAQADAAGAADITTAHAAVPQADVAGAADSISVHAAVPAAEVAGAVEAVTFPSPITAPQHDAAGAVDSMSVNTAGAPTLGGTLPAIILTQGLPAGYQGGPSGGASVPPSSAGNGWEIYVRSGLDYTTLLAVIPSSMLQSWQFARMLDDIGSGTVVLSLDDPWWGTVTLPGGLPARTLLDEECLWQVYKDGVCRFDFLGETVTEQLADPSEQRQVTVTGPGTAAVLKWAMAAPQGFPDIVLKLDGLLDSFDEVDVNGNGVLDTNIWTTATPSGDIYITPIVGLFSYPGGVGYNLGTLMPSGSLTMVASPGTTVLASTPWDFTDTLISAQVTPVGMVGVSTDATNPVPYGTGLDGSEVTQMFVTSNRDHGNYAMWGLSSSVFYAQLGGDGEIVTAYEGSGSYDSTQHAYWMITEQAGSGGGPGTFYWWTSPDGQNWSLWWQHVHFWDATNTFLTFAAKYDVAGVETAQITNLNSMVTTPSYQGDIYLGEPLMAVWLDQFQRAQGRGTIPFVTSNVTAAGDSYGRAWADTQNVQTVNGTDLYSLLQSGTAVVNADYVMDPGFQLRVGQAAPGQVALGVDRSGYIILREGYDTIAKQRVRARDQITTLLGGENADGHEISASSPAFITEWGQREAWFQAAVQVDPTSMAYASAAALAQNETEVLSWTFQLAPDLPGKTVFDNFDVGDWLGLERPDFSAVDRVRVTGIAVSVDSTGNEVHELTFVSYIQWLSQQLTYLANKLGGAFVNAVGTTPVAPSKYGTGQVPTWFAPAATLNSLADVTGASAGSTMSSAPLVYNPATGKYQHAGTTDPVSGSPLPVTVQTPAGSATIDGISVTVTTGSGSTVIGLQGDGTVTSVDSGGAPPAVPDAPAVIGIVQGLQVTWDGLLSGAAPLSNFQYVQVFVGTSAGFVPSLSTLVGALTTGGVLSVSGLTVSATYYVKLVAVSTSGAASLPTTAVSVAVVGLPTSALTGQLPASLIGNSAGSALNPNPFFNGGDLTGWAVVNGSVSSGAPPAGAPGGAQFAAEVTSTSANCLLTGSPAPFPVTPGDPYAMTSWVYNPGGSPVSIAVGFNWTSGTATVSVPAGIWTPVTTVQTCPGGVTGAYQVIGPTASGHTVWVLGAVAAGQVPGQLLVADSVTANQIAANTITASQIAAGTITAAQIAANTITASQIAAGTITAGQLAAGIVVAGIVNATTITGATIVADGTSGEILVYSGTPASGNLIGSWSAAAGTDAHSNSYLKDFTVYAAVNTGYISVSSTGGIGGNTAILFHPGFTSHVTLQPQIFGGSLNSGLVNEESYVEITSGGEGSGNDDTQIQLISEANNATLPATLNILFGGVLYVNMTRAIMNVAMPISCTLGTPSNPTLITTDTWNLISMDSGWSTLAGQTAPQYRLLPDNNVDMIGAAQFTGSFTTQNLASGGNVLPAVYRPTGQQYIAGGPGAAGLQVSGNGNLLAVAAASTTVTNFNGQTRLGI